MALKGVLQQIRILLVSPHSFFEERPPDQSILEASGIVLLVALATTATIAAIGWLFTSNIDATTTRTIMEPWPDSACDLHSDSETVSEPEPCTIDEPKTEEVAISSLMWDGFVSQLPFVFFGVLLSWVIVAGILHGLSALAGGDGSFTGTLSVVGWAMIPQFAQLLTGFVTMVFIVQGTDFSSDPAVLREQLEQFASLAPRTAGTIIGAGVIVWQAYIWTHGMRVARGLRVEEAVVVAGAVAVVTILFSVL